MLHLFRSSDGVETFGFLPRAGLSQLATIASQSYGTSASYHQYMVDGPTVEADAYIIPKGESSARWSNMVFGTMGAGGRSVFALNVPTADPTVMTANSVQWELNSHDDLGYVLTEMRVGHMIGGSKYYALFGNGPYSNSGKAALLVVDVQTGSVVKSIQVPTSGTNALGGVRVLRNSKNEIYAAYAGDIQGNVWRFDFGSGSDTSTWKVGFKGNAFYKAFDSSGTKAQPITATPAVVPHPSRGFVVLVGTGKLFDLDDSANTDTQSFYGLWDNTASGNSAADIDSPFASVTSGGSVTPYRDVLVRQVIDTSSTVTGTKVDAKGNVVNTNQTYYKVSAYTVSWTTKKGWYMDFSVRPGQRNVYTPQTVLTNVYMSTIVPASKALECEYTVGSGYNFVLDAATGASLSYPVFDTNNDGVVNANDSVAAGFQTLADGQDKLLSGQDGVVDSFNTTKCIPDVNAKCQRANSCLVVIVNTTNTADEVCVEGPNSTCPAGYDALDTRCACDPCTQRNPKNSIDMTILKASYADDCGGPVTTSSSGASCGKVITDRVWRQIMNPPRP
jgi:type IV pilus assembly protein PilY1